MSQNLIDRRRPQGADPRPPRGPLVAADLPSGGAYTHSVGVDTYSGEYAGMSEPPATPADSVIGRPLSVYPTLPAGGQEFVQQRYLETDYRTYGTVNLLSTSSPLITAPSGLVMVVREWKIEVLGCRLTDANTPPNFLPSPTEVPLDPLVGWLIKNGSPVVGSVASENIYGSGFPYSGTLFPPFSGYQPTHTILYGADTMDAAYRINSPGGPFALLPPPAVLLTIRGVYLLPNLMAPESTEQVIGKVKVVNE